MRKRLQLWRRNDLAAGALSNEGAVARDRLAAAEAGGYRVGEQLPRDFLFHLHEWHWNSACVVHQSVHGTKAIRRI